MDGLGGVLVLSGPPCSGKSTVLRSLMGGLAGQPRGAIAIEVDALFALLLPGSDRGREDRMLAYDAAHAVAGTLVRRGRPVVLECTYARAEQRRSLVRALAGVPEVRLQVVELVVTPEEVLRRFRQRRQDTDLDEVSVRERAEAFPYSDLALGLDASRPPDELARAITARLPAGSVDGDAWASAGRGWD